MKVPYSLACAFAHDIHALLNAFLCLDISHIKTHLRHHLYKSLPYYSHSRLHARLKNFLYTSVTLPSNIIAYFYLSNGLMNSSRVETVS